MSTHRLTDDTPPEEFDVSSMLSSRARNSLTERDLISFLMASTGDHARLLAQLVLVLQHFVRKHCDGEKIDSARLEKDWNNLAELFRFHAEAVAKEARDRREGRVV
ncbi:MAG: hypothetical protein JNN22_14100 [Rhodospirillales bacterium]|nr:hypothetical protein [Rhodospirillales bacterium]